MKRKINDVYPRPSVYDFSLAMFETFFFFCVSFSICEFSFQIASSFYSYDSAYGFYTYALFIWVVVISLVPISMAIIKPGMVKIYLLSLKLMYNTFSIHGVIFNFVLFWLTSCMIDGHNQLMSELLNMGIVGRFISSFIVSFIFDMVGYPWHRMVHIEMLTDDDNSHHLHHIDKNTLNFISGMANSPLDIYPMYIILILFVIFGNLPLFYLYTVMFFTLFSLEHCQAEGWSFIKFHVTHHRFYMCNYGDFFPIIDYIFGTLRLK